MVTETFIQPTIAEIEKFYDYLDSFYGDGGIYDMGATFGQFEAATHIHFCLSMMNGFVMITMGNRE